MNVGVVGRVRKLLEAIDANVGGDEEQVTLTQQLEQLIAAGAAPYAQIAAAGRSFQVTTTSAVAAAAAIPTTTGGLSLYNNEPDGGRAYIIDFISANGVATAAAGSGHAQMLALQGQVRETPPTNSALVPKKMNGMGSGLDTKARTILTGTALPATTGIAADWFPVGPSVERFATLSVPGQGLYWAAEGRVICPPGRYFSMQVLADTTASTFQLCIAWHEKQLTLG